MDAILNSIQSALQQSLTVSAVLVMLGLGVSILAGRFILWVLGE